MIAEAAVQEDVDAVGLSILSGAHMTLFPAVIARAAAARRRRHRRVRRRHRARRRSAGARTRPGSRAIFTPGATTQDIVDWVRADVRPTVVTMDFTLSDEHRHVVGDDPRLRRARDEAVRRRAGIGDEQFPHETVRQPRPASGSSASSLPEDVGGGGADALANALVVEGDRALRRLVRADGREPHRPRLGAHQPLRERRTSAQRYLPKLATGEWLGAWCLTEPGSGSDAGGAAHARGARRRALGARRAQDVHHPGHASAHVYVVLASTDAGRAARVASRRSSSSAARRGSATDGKIEKLGLRSSDTAEVVLEKVRVPADHLIGEEEQGFKQTLRILDGGRISIAAWCCGIGARRARGVARVRARSGGLRHARSPSSRRSSSCWRTWRRGSTPRASCSTARRWLKDSGEPFRRRGVDGEAGRVARRRCGRPPRRCRSTAATATCATSRSSATCATRSSARSARARARCSGSSSRRALLRDGLASL